MVRAPSSPKAGSSAFALYHSVRLTTDHGLESEGTRRAICDMTLLIFHLVLSTVTFEGIDVNMVRKIVEWNLERYPNGASIASVYLLQNH